MQILSSKHCLSKIVIFVIAITISTSTDLLQNLNLEEPDNVRSRVQISYFDTIEDFRYSNHI